MLFIFVASHVLVAYAFFTARFWSTSVYLGVNPFLTGWRAITWQPLIPVKK